MHDVRRVAIYARASTLDQTTENRLLELRRTHRLWLGGDRLRRYGRLRLERQTASARGRHPFQLGAGLREPRDRPGLKRQYDGPEDGCGALALEHFVLDLLGPDDEVFLYRFDTRPHLVENWTTDRNRIREDLGQIRPDGATALYDTVADCLPLLASGRHRKKALLVISDGIDTNSRTDLSALKQLIYQSEALIYAIGLGDQTIVEPLNGKTRRNELVRYQRRRPFPLPFPIPGGGRPPRNPPIPSAPPRGTSWPPKTGDDEPEDAKIPSDRERVDVAILHEITDDSGGRTELLRQSGDLDAATSRIADELSRQYYLAYPSRGYRDGRWHAIRVEVTNPSLHVRARRGYVASVD